MTPNGEPVISTQIVGDSEEGSTAYSSESNADNCSVESTPNSPPGENWKIIKHKYLLSVDKRHVDCLGDLIVPDSLRWVVIFKLIFRM